MPTKITVFYDDLTDAAMTEQAAALFPSIFSLATGGVRILSSDVEQARTS